MVEEPLSPEQARARLQQVQEELAELRQEEQRLKMEISRLQAELSRSGGRGRQRVQVTRSAALPSLKMEQRRLGAQIFHLEQEARSLRAQLDQD